MNITSWQTLLPLLGSDVDDGRAVIDALLDCCSWDQLPDIFHHVVVHTLTSLNLSLQDDAAQLLGKMTRKYLHLLSPLLRESQSDGQLLRMEDIRLDQILDQSKKQSIWLLDDVIVKERRCGPTSSASRSGSLDIYSTGWLTVQRNMVTALIGIETPCEYLQDSVRYSGVEACIDAADFLCTPEMQQGESERSPQVQCIVRATEFARRHDFSVRTKETWIARQFRVMIMGLLSPRWNVRRGYAFALEKIVMALQENSNGGTLLPPFLLQDALVSAFCVLILDHFIDVEGESISPVKSAMGLLMGSTLHTYLKIQRAAAPLAETWRLIVDMTHCQDYWSIRQGGFIALHHFAQLISEASTDSPAIIQFPIHPEVFCHETITMVAGAFADADGIEQILPSLTGILASITCIVSNDLQSQLSASFLLSIRLLIEKLSKLIQSFMNHDLCLMNSSAMLVHLMQMEQSVVSLYLVCISPHIDETAPDPRVLNIDSKKYGGMHFNAMQLLNSFTLLLQVAIRLILSGQLTTESLVIAETVLLWQQQLCTLIQNCVFNSDKSDSSTCSELTESTYMHLATAMLFVGCGGMMPSSTAAIAERSSRTASLVDTMKEQYERQIDLNCNLHRVKMFARYVATILVDSTSLPQPAELAHTDDRFCKAQQVFNEFFVDIALDTTDGTSALSSKLSDALHILNDDSAFMMRSIRSCYGWNSFCFMLSFMYLELNDKIGTSSNSCSTESVVLAMQSMLRNSGVGGPAGNFDSVKKRRKGRQVVVVSQDSRCSSNDASNNAIEPNLALMWIFCSVCGGNSNSIDYAFLNMITEARASLNDSGGLAKLLRNAELRVSNRAADALRAILLEPYNCSAVPQMLVLLITLKGLAIDHISKSFKAMFEDIYDNQNGVEVLVMFISAVVEGWRSDESSVRKIMNELGVICQQIDRLEYKLPVLASVLYGIKDIDLLKQFLNNNGGTTSSESFVRLVFVQTLDAAVEASNEINELHQWWNPIMLKLTSVSSSDRFFAVEVDYLYQTIYKIVADVSHQLKRRLFVILLLHALVESVDVRQLQYFSLWFMTALCGVGQKEAAVRRCSLQIFRSLIPIAPLALSNHSVAATPDLQLRELSAEHLLQCMFGQSAVTSINKSSTAMDNKVVTYLATHTNLVSGNATTKPYLSSAALRNYQWAGITWLTFLRRYGLSGILADEMGLGKSLQGLTCIAINRIEANMHTLPSLIVCPASLLHNWRNEIAKFFPESLLKPVVMGRDLRSDSHVFSDPSLVVLLSYNALRSISSRKMPSLISQRWEYILIDEAHLIKNPETATAKSVFALHAKYRIALTGTPVQNHAQELWSLMNFVMPDYIGSYEQFRSKFVLPIARAARNLINDQQGAQQLRDAEPPPQKKLRTDNTMSSNVTSMGASAVKLLRLLHKQVLPFILRRNKSVVASELPPKTVIDILTPLSSAQRQLYDSFLIDISVTEDSFVSQLEEIRSGRRDPKVHLDHDRGVFDSTAPSSSTLLSSNEFGDSSIAAAWNGDAALQNHRRRKTNPLAALLYLRLLSVHPALVLKEEQHSNYRNHLLQSNDSSTKLKRLALLLLESGVVNRDELHNDYSIDEFLSTLEPTSALSSQSAKNDDGMLSNYLDSSSTQSVAGSHRCLIFFQHRAALDVVSTQVLDKYFPGVNYRRLDGSTSPANRHEIISQFNLSSSQDASFFTTDSDKIKQLSATLPASVSTNNGTLTLNNARSDGADIRILLMTTRSCGLGLNLTGADTVIFVEHDWNPFVDIQAMDRAHRIGQDRPVTVYRLLSEATVEARIMCLQNLKIDMAEELINESNAGLVQVDSASTTAGNGRVGQNTVDFSSALWESLALSSENVEDDITQSFENSTRDSTDLHILLEQSGAVSAIGGVHGSI